MFQYILAEFTGTFFSYWLVFSCGAIFEHYAYCANQNLENKRMNQIMAKIEKMDISCMLNKELVKLNNKLDLLLNSMTNTDNNISKFLGIYDKKTQKDAKEDISVHVLPTTDEKSNNVYKERDVEELLSLKYE